MAVQKREHRFEVINKPKVIEGFFDIYLIRPMGYALVFVLHRTPITPNMLSVASLISALGASLCYFWRDFQGAIMGLFFMLLTSALDSADGQLARVTGKVSQQGRAVDGACDALSFFVIYAGIFFSYAYFVGKGVVFVFFLAWIAGFSHSFQSALTEYVRQLFLYYCVGPEKAHLDHPELIKQKLEALEKQKGTRLQRFLLSVLFHHGSEQRFLLRSSHRLFQEYQKVTENNPNLKEAFAVRYREKNEGLLPWWSLLFSNSHKIGIIISAFLPFLFSQGLIQQAGMVLYFVYDILLNFLMLALILIQRRADFQMRQFLFNPPFNTGR